jgi:ribosomal-protein-alanine N-acetyltransferase
MSGLTLRRMSAADLGQVALLDAMSFPMAWPPGAFAKELANPQARCWVIEVTADAPLKYGPAVGAPPNDLTVGPGQRAVGAMLVCWLVLDEAHIATLAVHPDLRRRGLGRLIMRRALEEAVREGAKMAYLEVREGNTAAQELYRAFGFEVTGRRPRYYVTEDAVLMTLEHLNVGMVEGWNQRTEES